MALVLLASGAPGALVVGIVLAAVPVGPLVAALPVARPLRAGAARADRHGARLGGSGRHRGGLVLQTVDQFVFGRPESSERCGRRADHRGGGQGRLRAAARGGPAHGSSTACSTGSSTPAWSGSASPSPRTSSTSPRRTWAARASAPAASGPRPAPSSYAASSAPSRTRLFTAAIGVGIGYAVVTRSAFWRVAAPVLGYAVAVLAHALWNGAAYYGGGALFLLTYLFLMVPAFVVMAAFALWARRREGQMLARALTDAADRGLLPAYEVPWLARIAGRRAARSHAAAGRRRAGPAGRCGSTSSRPSSSASSTTGSCGAPPPPTSSREGRRSWTGWPCCGRTSAFPTIA